MKEILLQEDSIISPLGFSTEENLEAIKKGKSALRSHKNSRFTDGTFCAGIIDRQLLELEFTEIGNSLQFTKLEQMMLLAAHRVIKGNQHIDLLTTALIISSTKGNIDLLQNLKGFSKERVSLNSLARVIQTFFGFKIKPIVVSNACISGGLAVVIAKRLIQAGKINAAVVVAGDLVSDFVASGFQSFNALSITPCKPFSKDRNGISLGEAAAAVYVSSTLSKSQSNISLIGDATANDANHISGPSRTGEGLFKSIELAIAESKINRNELGYISAHGTGTLFNDEMEAITFNRTGLENVPVNSFKGYYGHTLGASALIETILSKHSLLNKELYPSLNFKEIGVSKKLNVIRHLELKEFKYALKTASGFGGCNLAMILKKLDNE